MQHCGMRAFPPALILLGLTLAGCSPIALPRLLPPRAEPVAAPAPAEPDICLAWRRALDGYDAAGERRRLADRLRARGEDPARCEDTVAGKRAAPLSPAAAAAPSAPVMREAPRRAAAARTRKQPSTVSPNIDGSVTCSSELVKGPPDRYKTVCR